MTIARPKVSGGCSAQQVQAGETLLSETESLMRVLDIDRPTALLVLLMEKIEELTQATIEPPRLAPDAKEVLVIVKTVVTAGAPEQGPAIPMSPGYSTVIRQRRHSGATRTGYVAFERSDTGNPLNRIQFRDNDSIALPLRRLDSLWFDADNDDTSFELIVPFGQRREVD